MPVQLSLRSQELPDAELQRLTEELADTLRREAGVSAELPAERAGAGAKGDPITLGVIVLGFVSSGAAAALFNTLGAYFQRSRKLEVILTGRDGRSISLKSENVSERERDRILAQLRELLQE